MHELKNLAVNRTTYCLAGLSVVSELRLSGLLVGDLAESDEVVTISQGSVPTTLTSPVTLMKDVQYDGKAVLLTVPAVARYLVREGSEILVDAVPSAEENDIHAYLLGSAFGILCHQRGIVPLHSAAIDVKGGCVAFIGPSGAGKSTLVAALAARGHQIIADDVGFLRRDNHRMVMLWPGIGRIRLWHDALAALGCNGPAVEREARGHNKYIMPIRLPLNPFMPRRLRRIYYLSSAPPDNQTSIVQVQGAAAVEVLMLNVYRASIADCIGCKPIVFGVCASMANQLPVFQFSRPLCFEVLHQGIDILEDHLRDIR